MHLLAFVNRVESDIITPALDRRFGVNQVSLLCHRSELGLATDIAGVCRSLHLPASVVTLAADTQPLALRQPVALRGGLFPLRHARVRWRQGAAHGLVFVEGFLLDELALLVAKLQNRSQSSRLRPPVNY